MKFYDSLQEISDILDDWADRQPTTDVNMWNALMHKVRNKLSIGAEAIGRFCPDREYDAASPASGTLLHQAERAMSSAETAMRAHLKRHGAS